MTSHFDRQFKCPFQSTATAAFWMSCSALLGKLPIMWQKLIWGYLGYDLLTWKSWNLRDIFLYDLQGSAPCDSAPNSPEVPSPSWRARKPNDVPEKPHIWCVWWMFNEAFGGFHQSRYPKTNGLKRNILFQTDDLGYPYFRKPPFDVDT